MKAIVIQSEFDDRWLVCRQDNRGWATVVEDHLTERTAKIAAEKLQREFDKPVSGYIEPQFRQIPLGFYTDKDIE